MHLTMMFSMRCGIFSESSGTLSKHKDSQTYVSYRHTRLAKSLLDINFIEMLSLLTGYSYTTVKTEVLNNFFQTVELKKDDKSSDPQQIFHLDTFYPAFKFWFYLRC